MQTLPPRTPYSQFYVMAYPRVQSPGVSYILLFLITMLRNIYYLIFLTP